MRLMKKKPEIFESSAVTIESVEEGMQYFLMDTITDKKAVMHDEYVLPLQEANIITTEKFSRPVGVINDGFLSSVHDFNQFQHAVVPIEPGFHIVWMGYKQMPDSWFSKWLTDEPPLVAICRIDSFETSVFNNLFVNVTVLAKFEYNETMNYGDYDYAVKFLRKRILDTNITEGSTPRFAIDPTRMYDIRLFTWDGTNHVSHSPKGKKLVLNRKTSKYLTERIMGVANSERLKAGILMRIYFTKGQLNYTYMVVDGFELFEGSDITIKEEAKTRNKKVVTCKTKSDHQFIAFQDSKSIQACYRAWNGIRTVTLNDYEIAEIVEIVDGILPKRYF